MPTPRRRAPGAAARPRPPASLPPLATAGGLLLLATASLQAQERASSARGPEAGAAPYAAVDPALFGGLEYRSVGPSRGGRVTAVAGHPAHPHTFYMGSTGGGVWKTDDYGTTWRNVSDGFFDRTPAIGAIRVAPSDTSVVWVGTGSDGIRSNIIIGKGVYRSDDAGRTWRHVGLERAGQIGRMVVHPDDPDVAWVAAIGSPFGPGPDRGVYKTTDGGRSWDKILFIADTVGVYGLVMEPGNPDVLYASAWRAERKPWTIISGMRAEGGGGIYKSTDGGGTWSRLTEGLPGGLIGKIDLAISPAAPRRVYAVVEAPDPEEGVYRSDDAGATWRHVSDQRGLVDRPFYYTNIHVDPKDPDVVWVSNVTLFRSADGGETWERVRTPHVDNHDLWINPEDPDILIQGNDGGANVSLDGGRSWSTQHNQPTAELYQVDVDDRFPFWLYAGQQDNSTIAVPSLPPAEPAPSGPESWWKAIGGCETGPVVPRPESEALVVYANCKGRFGRFSMRTGQEQQYYVGGVNMYGVNPRELPFRFQRTVPIEVSPHDPDVVYHGSQYVHRTTDGGRTWETISPDLTAFRPERQVVSGAPITRDITGEEHYSTLYVIEASPHDLREIWAGANDGPVHVTRDGGATWDEVTPPDMPPEGRINAIELSPHRPEKAYVAGYRFLLDDFRPYLYRTTDRGRTWTLLTPGDNGIPADHPVRVVREDPAREGLLYAGTEFGMFVSFDDGASWQSFQLDLPVTPITDIEVVRGDLALSTMGRGFWILDDLTPLHQLGAHQDARVAHLFAPRAAYRMRYGGGFGPRPPHEPEFPPPGATVDYWLEGPAPGLVLEILDAEGRAIRSFQPQEEADTAAEREGDGRGARGEPEPATEPGAHRFRWDLRHPPPEGGGRGPLAVPGDYTVRLTLGEWSATQPLTVRMDPRVEADGVTVEDLRAQLEHNLRVRDALSEARAAARRVEELRERGLPAGDRAALEALADELITDPEVSSYPSPMLVDQLQYLYGMTTRADQRPGMDAEERYDELRERLDRILTELSRLERRVAGA